MYKKEYVWNPSTCICQHRKYLAINDPAIICDEVVEETVRTNLMKI